MTKIDIISGFLGAGKTTLIKKLLGDALKDEKVILIENEFGEIGIDSGFLKESGVQVTEMNAGCICCSLVGDFGNALRDVLTQFSPDRILIEPSGVGKLSDVIAAVNDVAKEIDVSLNSFITVCDVSKCRMYIRNFGEFYLNQVQNACAIFLSRTAEASPEQVDKVTAMLREHNEKARIVTTPWSELTSAQLLAAMESSHSLADEMLHEMHGHDAHAHEHHHEHDEHCDCHDHEHHHEHDEHCGCHDHDHAHEHHHEHDEHCGCHDHEHEHHHEHGEGCTCGCHDHDHHHADEVFTSWGVETPHKYNKNDLLAILEKLDSASLGIVLRAKGIVPSDEGTWLHFDYVPGEPEIREGAPDYTGRLCVIGSNLDEERIRELFGLS